jgi:hypothetical protein
MQGRRMQHDFDTRHAAADEIAIGDRAAIGGERAGHSIDAGHRVSERRQGAHQRFAEMAGAPGDQNFHGFTAADLERRKMSSRLKV